MMVAEIECYGGDADSPNDDGTRACAGCGKGVTMTDDDHIYCRVPLCEACQAPKEEADDEKA